MRRTNAVWCGVAAVAVLVATTLQATPDVAHHHLPVAKVAPTHLHQALRLRALEVALDQKRTLDPAWQPAQRDCAGLVRFAYRHAYKALWPQRLGTPLFVDTQGRPSDFADAETLVQHAFVQLSRDLDAAGIETGDLAVFRQDDGAGGIQYHLMLLLVPASHSAGHAASVRDIHVVYHPGDGSDTIRTGSLAGLLHEAPLAWQPQIQNPSFLGYFRFKEWHHVNAN